ncbi:C-type lectin domain family 3 member A-like isoform X1 [Leucoraja erinacea]|uniref:C-type lectin domain family 3 member A-like isoform X1 n=1 Tax=Leucoraja erinaceus TaxID=7782 RepID=UPI002457AE51|nr:C-type lectin domain family 3 member A-like isoform X1 [Leucoraja erinacea]
MIIALRKGAASFSLSLSFPPALPYNSGSEIQPCIRCCYGTYPLEDLLFSFLDLHRCKRGMFSQVQVPQCLRVAVLTGTEFLVVPLACGAPQRGVVLTALSRPSTVCLRCSNAVQSARGAGRSQPQEFCKHQHDYAHLASVSSGEHNIFLKKMIDARNNTCPQIWIGLNDILREGTLVWVDGSTHIYRHWLQGEPNDNGGIQDCVVINNDDEGLWSDRSCLETEGYICSYH